VRLALLQLGHRRPPPGRAGRQGDDLGAVGALLDGLDVGPRLDGRIIGATRAGGARVAAVAATVRPQEDELAKAQLELTRARAELRRVRAELGRMRTGISIRDARLASTKEQLRRERSRAEQLSVKLETLKASRTHRFAQRYWRFRRRLRHPFTRF
jgi:hypothetical protein